jgi:hypothetical protein
LTESSVSRFAPDAACYQDYDKLAIMSPNRRLTAFLLIAALIISGVPMVSAGAADESGTAATQTAQPGEPADQAPSDCPLHASNSELLDSTHIESDPCSGSDCRCSCTGISVMVHNILQTDALIPSTRDHKAHTSNLPSLPSDGLLRPPQA